MSLSVIVYLIPVIQGLSLNLKLGLWPNKSQQAYKSTWSYPALYVDAGIQTEVLTLV